MATANVAVDTDSDIDLPDESVETSDAATDGGSNAEPDGDDTDTSDAPDDSDSDFECSDAELGTYPRNTTLFYLLW
jgi:hypothetical protein